MANFVELKKDGRSPSPTAQKLARLFIKRQKIDVFWDDGGIDVADPKERVPRGLYLETKNKVLFLSIDEIVAALGNAEEKNADE